MVGLGRTAWAGIGVAILASLMVVTATPGVTATPTNTVVGSNHSTDADFRRGTLSGQATVSGSGGSAVVNLSPVKSTNSQTFSFTGSEQTWTVPSGVDTVTVDVWGAQGSNAGDGNGGHGGHVKGTLSTTPGETLYIYVGGQGSVPAGGWPNGGRGGEDSSPWGGGGGGSSDIRQGGNAVSNQVVVGAGGGGAGDSDGNGPDGDGADGGPDTGADAEDVTEFDGGTAEGGDGGTQSSGGSGGAGNQFDAAEDGSRNSGGDGGEQSQADGDGGGGGGGGGYYGGGGGATGGNTNAASAGGGGGSNYDDGLAAVTTNSRGTGKTGDGSVNISWTLPSTATYISANHSVENSVSGFTNLTFSSGSAVVTWEGWDGSEWIQLHKTTYSTTGNHTATWSEFDGEKVRVNVTMTDGGVKLHSEGVSYTKHEPQEPQEQTPTPGDDGSDGRSRDADDDDGAGGGGGDGNSGPAVEVTRDSTDAFRVQIQDASRGIPATVRLTSGVGRTGRGAGLVTLRITSGGPSEFEIVTRYAGEPPTGAPALANATGQAGLTYVTLDHEFTDADVATARLTFRVEKAKLDAWGADPASVTLYRFEDGGWVSYDTRQVGEDGGAYYVSATFPGLSLFAVGADREVTPTRTEAATPTAAPPDTAAAVVSGGETTPAVRQVESRNELGFGILAIFGLLAVLFGVGYIGGGSLVHWYEKW